MPAEFRPTDPSELEAVRALMQHSFHTSAETPSLNRSLLQWKYYQSGPAWQGSRSYVLSDKGQFVAHAAIWPIDLRLSSGIRSGIGFCDWAASEEHRGIGLLLLKRLTALAPFVLVIGGADITRQILPRVGFKPWAELPVYARVLRPFRQLVTRKAHNWKEPVRLARNTLWSLSSLAPAAGWSAKPRLPDEHLLSQVHQEPGSTHTVDFLRFLLDCPTVRFLSLVLVQNGVPQGYAILSVVGGQGRIADLRIASREQLAWNSAVAVVAQSCAQERDVCELSSLASVPLLENALQANGFRLREHRPLVALDTQGTMTNEPVPQLGMLVDDASFNYFPEFPYLT